MPLSVYTSVFLGYGYCFLLHSLEGIVYSIPVVVSLSVSYHLIASYPILFPSTAALLSVQSPFSVILYQVHYFFLKLSSSIHLKSGTDQRFSSVVARQQSSSPVTEASPDTATTPKPSEDATVQFHFTLHSLSPFSPFLQQLGQVPSTTSTTHGTGHFISPFSSHHLWVRHPFSCSSWVKSLLQQGHFPSTLRGTTPLSPGTPTRCARHRSGFTSDPD